ncbi:MAG: riboflavin biosynthesis protein RibF [Ignavibacteria bacterium]|nr:MAG: riboflavin biosynthesis protein RibF [Ignavibacteria bacterium]KAF0161455.1 MAG: riboflavin biosynthesis protein RibF [Ignavibacteria bacterium]
MIVYSDRFEKDKTRSSVVTVGSFDGLHLGHLKILQKVKQVAQESDFDSFVVTFDPHPRSVLAQNSEVSILTSLDEKKWIIEEAGIENLMVIHFTREFSQLTSDEFIKKFVLEKLNASHMVIGHDHKFGRDRLGDENKLREIGAQLGFDVTAVAAECLNKVTISSTKVRNFLFAGELDIANQFLGRLYSICGIVVKGAQRGRTLGFPTANIQVDDPKKAIPKNGVYVVRCSLGKESYYGVMNIGFRPTFENKQEIVPEAYILNFDRDIYGEKIKIEFVKRLRDEKKFESKGSLIQQIETDKKEAEKIASLNKN